MAVYLLLALKYNEESIIVTNKETYDGSTTEDAGDHGGNAITTAAAVDRTKYVLLFMLLLNYIENCHYTTNTHHSDNLD
jgi:hypothetical protein